MKTDHEMLRVKVTNMLERALREREELFERIRTIDNERAVNLQLLAVLKANIKEGAP